MTTTTKGRKVTKEITCTVEDKELFDNLYERAKAKGDFTGTKTEYVHYILEREKLRSNEPSPKPETIDNKESDDNQPLAWFVNISGKNNEEKQNKLIEIKQILGITEDEEIIFTRQELYVKASEISGKSVEEIKKEGADSEAQKIITAMRNPEKSGQGRLGSADNALDVAFKEIVEMIQSGMYTPKEGVPITKISQRAGANFNSAKSWSKRRGFNFPMAIDHAVKFAEKL